MTFKNVSRSRSSQCGGITILVALMLLVLLTVMALGMSRNSLREVIITGTSRQGAVARNDADSALEWSLYWLAPANAATGGGADTFARTFVQNFNTLSGTTNMAGVPLSLDPMTLYQDAARTDQAIVTLTRIGKTEPSGTPSGSPTQVTAGAFAQVPWELWPDVWSLRADVKVSYTGGLTFAHSKEAWASNPARTW